MKKVLSVILSLCMLLSLTGGIPFTVSAETAVEVGDGVLLTDDGLWECAVYGDGVEVTAYYGEATDVYVPARVECGDEKYAVIKLGEGLFADNDALNSVTLGEGITEIGDRAFYDADNLVCIVNVESLTTIGDEAFYSCDHFNSVILYDGLVSIGADAFAQCPALTIWCNEGTVGYDYAIANGVDYEILNPNAEPEIVELDGITYYLMNGEAYAVTSDPNLTEAIIPATVQGCPVVELRGTFANNSKLVRVTLPDGLKKIGEKAFYSCSKLIEVIIPDSVIEIGEYSFGSCRKLTEITLPQNLITIGGSAFASCTSLTQVTIPNSVKSVGNSAFSSCYNLQTVVIGANVTEISLMTFSDCRSLKEVFLPNNLQTIRSSAFDSCTALRRILIPQSVTKLYSDSFSNSTIWMVYEDSYAHSFVQKNNLWYFVYDGTSMPTFCEVGGITYCLMNNEAYAIASDPNLTEVIIPATVQGCPVVELRGTFNNHSKLEYVELPSGLRKIGERAFYYCSKLTKIVIPDSVIEIGTNAFYSCVGLTKIELPKNLLTIGLYAFSSCDGLKEITLPDDLEKVGTAAFSNCNNLQTVIIGASVTKISSYAFAYCNNLTNVVLPQSLQTVESAAFGNCPALRKVLIPQSVTKMYDSSFLNNTVLMVCDNSYAHTFAQDNDFLYFVYDGTSEPEFYDVGGVAFYLANGEAYAVSSDPGLIEATIPVTVQGCHVVETRSTFHNNSKLEHVILPNGLKKIGERTFYGCYKLIDLTVPDSVTEIGAYAFESCYKLTEIQLPKNLITLGYNAFSSCSITQVTIPDRVETIGSSAFSVCNNLHAVTIGANVKVIDQRAFSSCSSLSQVILPEGLQTVENNAFSSCSSLRTVLIPQSVTSMHKQAFPISTVLMVYENSYAHTFAQENDLLYFVLHKADNPEIYYGTGITDIVTYSDGEVAAGATVEILYDDGTVKETVTADANGAYTFTYAEVGVYTVRATDANGNTATTQVAVKRMNAFEVFLAGDTALNLKKSHTVSGMVNAGGASVTITDLDGNIIASVTADENGTFTITNLPNGTYIITATTENGSVSQEITVFNGNLSDLHLAIAPATATIWGYTAVQHRDGTTSNRNWVQVTIYNAEGIAVAQCKSDTNGKYTFDKLPLGTYNVVAETTEMRPDKHYGFDRSHTLTGFAYVTVTANATCQADIVLCEQEEEIIGVSVSGKVTANGQKQVCDVVLSNVFCHEVARYATGSNGKYHFANVPDGMYIITATTESDGMGFAVITIRNGEVYGETDITVAKTDKITQREAQFNADLAACLDQESAVALRDRIAEEKRFYDGLSQKEKKQLSKSYVEQLNRLVEWVANVNYDIVEGVTVQQGGLVVSGDELESEADISYTIHVEKTDGHTASTDGVNSREDFIQHAIEDTAGDYTTVQHYEITMTKTVGGKEQLITNVYKDTNATGKFRITLEIPEEHRGHRHYSILHEHCGEVVRLADLDDDPNTITIEIDAFSGFTLAATDKELTVEDSLFSGGETSRTEETKTGLGLAFKFNIAANGIAVKNGNVADLSGATVTVNGTEYALLEFGAVVSNDATIDDLTLEDLSGKTVKIEAKYLLSWEDGADYAVRLINIPTDHVDTTIYARPYVVYVNDAGEQVVVYGDTVSDSYNG